MVSHGSLAVKHGPFPWLGNETLSASEIKQLYAKADESSDGEPDTFAVHAVTHIGMNVQLVSGLDSSEQALFVEQEIEKYLADEPVTALRDPLSVRVRRWMRKHPGFTASSVMTGLLVLVFLTLMAARWGP